MAIQDPERVVADAIAQRWDAIETAINTLPIESTDTIVDAARHPIEAGGKRVRPALCLLVTEAITEKQYDDIDYRSVTGKHGSSADVLAMAGAVEATHTSTIVHDDIMDDDELRRGSEAVHTTYGTSVGILSGLVLLNASFTAIANANVPKDRRFDALRKMIETYRDLCTGQALDLEFEDRTPDAVTIEDYCEMAKYKTGSLFAMAATMPAIVLGCSEETIDALDEFGHRAGLAFQIHDDIIDLTADPEVSGKPRGSDLIDPKTTPITIHAANNGIDVTNLITSEQPDEVQVEEAVEQLHASGSIEHAREMAFEEAEMARDALDHIPDTDATKALEALVVYGIQRDA